MNRILPWPTYGEPWELAVAALVIDGVEVMLDECIDLSRSVVTLPEEWVEAVFTVVASTDQAFSGGPAAAVLCLNSPRTLLRLSETVEGVGPFSWTLQVFHDDLAGAVDLDVEVVSAFDGRIRTIGRTAPWKIVIDAGRRPTPPGLPPVDFEWIDFASASAPGIARANPKQHVVVDVDGDEPRVYFNEAIEGLQQILYLESARMERRLYRNIIAADIAAAITSALVRQSFARVDVENPLDSAMPPIYLSALSGIAVAMSMDFEDLMRAFNQAEKDGGLSGFYASVDVAVDQITGRADAIAEMAKEALR